MPYPASYAGRSTEGVDHVVPVSCCLSATGVRFWAILRPLGSWAFLAVGLPEANSPLDPIGVVTFHMSEVRPGWVPPEPRGRWCVPG
jgi:hypothetical protein